MGFLVFSAVPLALLVFLVFGIIAVRSVAREADSRWKKWISGTVTTLLVLLLLTWDVIAGRVHFNHLCATESGIKIYKRVIPDPEYRDIQFSGNPLGYERLPIAKRYPYGFESSEKISGPGTIKYSREFIRDAQTGETLGTFTSYFWGGGWFENTFSIQGAGGGGCGYETGGFLALTKQIFEIPR